MIVIGNKYSFCTFEIIKILEFRGLIFCRPGKQGKQRFIRCYIIGFFISIDKTSAQRVNAVLFRFKSVINIFTADGKFVIAELKISCAGVFIIGKRFSCITGS